MGTTHSLLGVCGGYFFRNGALITSGRVIAPTAFGDYGDLLNKQTAGRNNQKKRITLSSTTHAYCIGTATKKLSLHR